MLTTTLTELKFHHACDIGLKTLTKHLGADWGESSPISLETILESNGLDHAIWALRTQEKRYSVQFAVKCAESILPIFEKQYPEDSQPRKAIEAAKNWLSDPSEENRKAARVAYYAAYAAASDAAHAAHAAAHAAAAAAADAAYAAAAHAAAHAAADASAAAAAAADAAYADASAAAADASAAAAAARAAQKEIYVSVINKEELTEG